MNFNTFNFRAFQYLCMLLIAGSLSLTLGSCDKSGTVSFTNLPVVESYLSPGGKIYVTVSNKVPYDQSIFISDTSLDDLDLEIVVAGVTYHLVWLGGGVYADTCGEIALTPGSSYDLQFDFNGIQITSTTEIPSKPDSVEMSVSSIEMSQFDPENPTGSQHPDPVIITYSNNDNSYYMTMIECIDSVLVPVFKDSIPANDIFSSIPTTGSTISIEPMRIRYFGINRIILYHINPEYSLFFKHQTTTSQNYQDPSSNITNGLGIFTGINADTLFLNVKQVK